LGFQNITDAGGIGLAVTGLTIVFAVLVLVSLFISGLPRVLPTINSILPEPEGHYGAPMPSAVSPQMAAGLEEEVVAAIGFALHSRGGTSQNTG